MLTDEQDAVLWALVALHGGTPAGVLRRVAAEALRDLATDPEVVAAMAQQQAYQQERLLEAEHARLVRERKHLRVVS
jgi:hypothetical protein